MSKLYETMVRSLRQLSILELASSLRDEDVEVRSLEGDNALNYRKAGVTFEPYGLVRWGEVTWFVDRDGELHPYVVNANYLYEEFR